MFPLPPAFHSMFVHLLTGLFFFTVIAVLVRAFITCRGLPSRGPIAVASDLGAYWSAIIGIVFSLISILTGFLLQTLGAAINSPVIRNKILTAVVLTVVFGVFVAMRYRLGEGMWRNGWLALFAVFLAVAGYHWNLVTNSIGGEIAGVPSGYETIVRLSGVETRFTYYLPWWVLALIAVAAIGLVAFAYLTSDRDEVEEDEAVGSGTGS